MSWQCSDLNSDRDERCSVAQSQKPWDLYILNEWLQTDSTNKCIRDPSSNPTHMIIERTWNVAAIVFALVMQMHHEQFEPTFNHKSHSITIVMIAAASLYIKISSFLKIICKISIESIESGSPALSISKLDGRSPRHFWCKKAHNHQIYFCSWIYSLYLALHI